MLKTVDARGAELRAVLGKRTLGIAGDHQYGNANLAIHLCNAATAEDTGKRRMPSLVDYLHETKTLQGLMQANWPARCQTVSRPGSSFEFRLDGAHTPLSLTATMEWFTKKSALTPRRILIFNCRHERNPIELLDLLKDGKFACVYFAKPDSSRPSPVRVQTAQELLEEANIAVHDDWVNSIRKQRGGEETWQETLGILWKHLVPPSSRKVLAHGGHVSHHAVPLVCNKISREIIRDLSTTSIEPTEVLVTGSLYLVGSFLTALDWSEESSPDQSALLG
jgi:folylpolyglutamate synthase